jgi:hypothetical protein
MQAKYAVSTPHLLIASNQQRLFLNKQLFLEYSESAQGYPINTFTPHMNI